MKITELKNNVAVQIDDFDIRDITPENAKKINDITKDRTIVVIKRQDRTPANFVKFVKHLGPIANWTQFNFDPITGEEIYKPTDEDGFIEPSDWPNPNTYPVQRVAHKQIDGKRTGIFGSGVLDWHANLNGPTRADAVALQGWTNCESTSTTWLNTTKVYDDMPQELLDRCQNIHAEYEYAPEVWAKGLPEAQLNRMMTNKSKYKMWLIQKNIAGKTGIYFYTNNKCKIITDDKKLYNDLYDFMFQDRYMYQHFYEIGDIVLSDQVLSLHKRDQNDPKLLEERVLHRITYRLSNIDKLPWVAEYNKGCTSEKV
jgi:alpha-ketoglutarate-dependent taurine dioxygenase